MKVSEVLKTKVDKTLTASLIVLSASLGTMFVADKINVSNVLAEQSVISEVSNNTLNISFVPNNPYMKNNVKLFNAITRTDIDNISRIQGVKSVKPIDTEYNPLSGYLKVNSKSTYIELYGMSESGEDANKNSIEMVYGRSINSSDRGKNVIVLNMETVNALQVPDAKALIGTGVEINNAMYEVVGIMNVVLADERDNSNELEHTSLIPKSTSKEILARANAKSDSYSAITVSVKEGSNANAVETAIYNLLYQKHEGINGYYERDVEYNLSKKLDPTLNMFDNFIKCLKVGIAGSTLIALFALARVFKKTDDEYEEIEVVEDDSNDNDLNNDEVITESDEIKEDEEVAEDNDEVEDSSNSEDDDEYEDDESKHVNKGDNSDSTENVEINSENAQVETTDAEVIEDKGSKNTGESIGEVEVVEEERKKFTFIKSNKENIILIISVIIMSMAASTYYLSGKSIDNIFNISLGIKAVIVLISLYLIKITNKK